MADFDVALPNLRNLISEAECRLEELRAQLQVHEDLQHAALVDAAGEGHALPPSIEDDCARIDLSHPSHHRPSAVLPLPAEDYTRYARQLIVPQIGLAGHRRLGAARVLVVGLGGLGSPAAAYLAGAGVSTLGLIDADVVDVSNLHRQIIHSTDRVGVTKVDSARTYIQSLNPHVRCITYPTHITPASALHIVQQYDVVLDCTDHPASRYLISDACVSARKPLVSASALKTEGQLMVLNHPARPAGDRTGGPCYRCIFPRPPPPETVDTCGEAGILGPVVGVMGVMQALEAIKLISSGVIDLSDPSDRATPDQDPPFTPYLLMFSAYSTPQFRHVRLRSKRQDCRSCSSDLNLSSLDYATFCGRKSPQSLLSAQDRIDTRTCATRLDQSDPATILLDVRDSVHFDLCHLPNSINVPLDRLRDFLDQDSEQRRTLWAKREIDVICRLGNDSQVAVQLLRATQRQGQGQAHESGHGSGGFAPGVVIRDVRGGFAAWRETVDPSWPDI